MLYKLHCIQLESCIAIESFAPFLSEKDEALKTVVLKVSEEPFRAEKTLFLFEHAHINVSVLDDGWLYSLPDDNSCVLFASKDYSELTAYNTLPQIENRKLLPLLRTALESAAAMQGLVSLHSSCIKIDEKAVCFTASSGVGKSTRAQSWIDSFGAKMLSGDRPTIKIDANGVFACGAPWDGKEQIFVNDSAPLAAICNIRRGNFTRVRRLSYNQARRILMQQCFIPMWDNCAATAVLAMVSRLCRTVPVYRVICGPDESSARQTKEIIFHRNDEIPEMEKDMKIKNGFVLKSIAGENIVMPAGNNISSFDGAIVLNEVAAFVWSKLEESISRNELLEHILSEFDVDKETASRDLDTLLEKLISYGVIEEETI